MDALRSLFTDNIRSRPESVEQYVRGIALVYELCHNRPLPSTLDLTFLGSDAPSFTQLVHERYDNPGSRRTRLAPFLAACKKLEYSEAYQTYFRPFKQDNKSLKELREKQAVENADDSTKVHEMTREDVELFGAKLARRVRLLPDADGLDRKDVKAIMIHVLVEWHLLMKPNVRRGLKLYHLPILFKNKREVHDDSIDALIQISRSKQIFQLRKQGEVYELPKMFCKCLVRTLELIPRAYFITLVSDPLTPMSGSNYSKFCAKLLFNEKLLNLERL
jgi:hypothetical protein